VQKGPIFEDVSEVKNITGQQEIHSIHDWGLLIGG